VVERAARIGDRVTINFDGTIDGEPFRGGTGNDVGVLLGEGRMLKDFESGLTGISAGEERSIEVEFPADYGAEEVAGKKAQFKVTTLKVEEPHLPDVDDDFCRSFGIEEGGVERLRAEVEDNMREELQQRVARGRQAPVARQAGRGQQLRYSRRAARAGNPEPAGRHGAPDEPARPAGRQGGASAARALRVAGPVRVALGLLIGEIVRNNGIRVDAGEVQQRLQEIGEGYGDAEAVIKIYRANPELMSQVETAVLEEQVVDWLLERAQVTDKPVGFSEFMNQDKA
jgi:trigger factor